MMEEQPDIRSREITKQLLTGLQDFLAQNQDPVKFEDLVSTFPTIYPTTLVTALTDLGNRSGFSFVIRDDTLFVTRK